MKIPKRTLADIRNDIERTKGNITEVSNGTLFTEKDKEILLPKYNKILENLKKEELLNLPVIAPETIIG